MKKISLNVILLLSLSIYFVSCDFVQDANPPVSPSGGNNNNPSVIYRKVLVEDYTGHKCGNCPKAADTLTYIESKYPGQIVPVAVHAGFYALTNAAYPTDFQTAVGNTYDNTFGNSAAGNPNGLVNRAGFTAGSTVFIKNYPTWEGAIAQMLNQPASFQIKIKNNFNTSNNQLSTDVMVRSLAVNSGTYKLVVLLTEDSIIAEQLDYRVPVPPAPSQKITNYEFNHVLRSAINNTWGDAVFTGGAALNDSVVKSFPNIPISSSYRPAKCHVVAFIYDADAASPTYYEVFQVEEAHLE
jgi:thiol-disulfide isomerase/thioredoxin